MKNIEIAKFLGLGRSKVKIVKMVTEEYKGKKVKMIYLEQTNIKCRCPKCNKFTNSVHSKLKQSYIKESDFLGYECVLTIRKRRFRCYECEKIFTETIDILPNKNTISNRLRIQIHKDLLKMLTFDYIAEKNHVSITFVINELKSIMKDYKKNIYTLPEVISFDEFKADTDKGKYAFIINDPINKKTIDILPNRRKEYLIKYFTTVNNRKEVEYVICDMYEPYLIVTKVMFPRAKYIVDRFHYVEYIMDALDDIRIRVQKEYEYNTREYRLLKNKKNVSLLRKYSEDINWFKQVTRYRNKTKIYKYPKEILDEIFDISEDIKIGYDLKELFLQIINNSTYESAKADLESWIDLCRESKIEEFIVASKTIENWLDYIVNSFIDKRFTNGYTEGLNNKIKTLKRMGFGYKKFEIFRSRLMYIFDGKLK